MLRTMKAHQKIIVVGLKDERWSQRELYTMPTKKTLIAALYDN